MFFRDCARQEARGAHSEVVVLWGLARVQVPPHVSPRQKTADCGLIGPRSATLGWNKESPGIIRGQRRQQCQGLLFFAAAGCRQK